MDAIETLLGAFNIERNDLEANRAGRLGPTQARNLLRSGTSNLAGALLIGIGLGVIVLLFANKPLVPAQVITAGVLFAIVLVVGAVYFRRTRKAVSDGRVESLVGPVVVRSRGTAGWYLFVAEQTFRVPINPMLIQQDAAYRVYFVPSTHNIVAMEPVVTSTNPASN